MARKKFYADEPIQAENKKPALWKVGLYIRLSREDGDKAVSDSITNQKKILKYYVQDHSDFFDYECFIDENITGTNFNRPAFQKMVDKIKAGDINCVIVKDLSRFGRDYLGAGYYLENVFQKYNCRFISIIDEIDTYTNKELVTGLMVRIKNLAHDNNSQNISLNVRRTKNSMRAQGKFIALPPYGYHRDPNNKYHLIANHNVAPIIRNIFDWYIEGNGVIMIAKKLNALGVNTRAEYKKTGNVYIADSKIISKSWDPDSVRRMLENKVYIGAVAQHKETTANYKDRKRYFLPEDEQIIVYDMHEPIISKEKFNLVQEIIKKRCCKTPNNQDIVHLFSGFLKCSDCNSSMIRNSTTLKGKAYVYYKCRAYYKQGITACAHSHSIRHELLYDAVLITLNKHISTLIKLEEIIKHINKSKEIKTISIDYNKVIQSKEIKISQFKNLKYEAYTSWKMKEISKQDYQYAVVKYDTALEKLNSDKIKLENDKLAEEDIRSNKYLWLESAVSQGEFTQLTREILTALIDNIYITKELGIRIAFKYRDEFERLTQYAKIHAKSLNPAKGVAHA